MVHSVPQAHSRAPRRCVVLVAKEAAPPTALLAGLSQRQVTTVLVYDPPAAMLQLAEAATTSLIIVQPQRQPRLKELVAAVEQYFPRTRIWQYAKAPGNDQPSLSKLDLPCQCQQAHSANGSVARDVPQEADHLPYAAKAAPEQKQPARDTAEAGRSDFLAAREQMAQRRQPPAGMGQGKGQMGSMEREQDGPLISPQELAMLLGSPEDELDVGGEKER